METVIRRDAWDVGSRLAELGLEEERLREVVRRGHVAYASCTGNHPPFIPAIWAWGETVRALREYLLPLKWERSNDRNYSLTVDPMGRVAIAVATGNDATGRSDVSPSTKAPKGPSTAEAILVNQLLLGFMEPEPEPAVAESSSAVVEEPAATWVLLVHRTADEVRCELSLPSSITVDGRIDGWTERILLGPIPLDGEPVDVLPPHQPDIIIDVRRRA